MRHGSLFSGIGGFDLAAEWMGWENVFQVEKDSFCQKVLAKNFPNTARYGDIKEFGGTKYRGAVDIISGGFPCQPFSVAGKRKGKEDDRFLWPEMLRIIREVKPSFIVGENVTGIIGLALDQVLTEVEAQGYHAETFIIPACAVSAPHRRDRVWIVAHSNRHRESDESCNGYSRRRELGSTTANTDSQGLQGCKINGSVRTLWKIGEQYAAGYVPPDWQEFPTQPPVCGRNDGIPNRVDRIKALGNAIVPQVAYEIFKAIELITHEETKQDPL